jgi:hypothetical protein
MSSASPKSADQWLELQCPRCKAQFRIKTAYAYMSGRCPNCGRPIEPPRPIPSPSPITSESNEPLGLVPIEEEWPEPAQMDLDDRPLYGLDSVPWQGEQPKPEAPAPAQGYGLAEPLPPPPSPPPAPVITEAYQVTLPEAPPQPAVEVHLPPPSQEPEGVPQPPSLPPAHPLLVGVWGFPWRKENLGAWIFLTLALTFLGGGLALLLFLIEGGATALFVPVLIPPLAIIALFVVNFAAAHFLNTLQETAAGNDYCQKPELGAEWLGLALFLLYVIGMSLVPCGLAIMTAYAFNVPETSLWPIGLTVTAILFPIMLLSALAAQSRWIILHPIVIVGLLKKPLTFLVLSFVSVAMMGLCAALGAGTLMGYLLLAPLFGVAAATCLLIYARLLGRVGWIITEGSIKPRKKKRKRRKSSDLDEAPKFEEAI